MRRYNRTILIVEDLPTDRLLLVKAFRAAGATGPIHAVEDGAEAIAYMMGEGKYSNREKYAFPSFIITDLKMPKLDGFAVLEHLKRNPEWAVIPTVVFTASTDPDDIKNSYRLGASSFHVKPDTFEGFRTQLRVLHEYWMTCEVPEVDITGKYLPTESQGKVGERFGPAFKATETKQTR